MDAPIQTATRADWIGLAKTMEIVDCFALGLIWVFW